jgi:alpha-glucosidase
MSHMKKIVQLCIAFLFLLPALNSFAADTTMITSPDRNIRFRLFVQNNQLSYRVTFKNKDVITASPLVVSLDNAPVTSHISIGSMRSFAVHEQYPWQGVHSIAQNQYNEARIPITKNNFTYTIEVRAFNDGAAFRLILPGAQNTARIPDEATVFNMPENSTVWYHDLEMHYEGIHTKKEVAQVQQGEWIAPPATFKLPQGIYAAITEADLKDYSGMALQANGKSGFKICLAHNQPTSYPYRLRYSPEDTLRLKKPASIAGTITTPWRVVMIGADLNAMVNNDIVHNLCPPANTALFPKGTNTAWVRPGRAVWKYLDGGGEGTLEVMKKFTDGAAALGFEHNILEGFWSRWSDEQIRELVNYSKQKNVGIWFWKHSKNLRDASARDSFFRSCADLGVVGVKLDFFDHEAKETIDQYESILQETAKYHLLVDFHGANKPTGQARTWPNEMVRESVKGMEASKLEDRATHEVTIPFTRFLAGPAEYTVMHFGARRKNTTWAHQIASAAILSAPLLTYAAHPDSMLANPAVNVIKAIPATWDETIVLPPSEIGELAVYARRKGDTWFVAVMNGAQSKQINIPLNFLKSGKYKATTVHDDPSSAASVKMGEGSFTSKDVIKLNLVGGGGFIAQFTK